ncbi:carbohydrate-binding protein [Altericroceibacterium endophyticum]|uniref:Chitin-binding type-3 domain-containing protein n=1 Tax=Altericroceibacterium endophyticum TaxID=1808508 RepID=A0A6I4T2Z0_9SPHN|nr:carbohydrate-binding protein [Altericroceibacterium endophyticum]MXO64581.1 hypothetical protein [Altericroceibacterium endophyticum]
MSRKLPINMLAFALVAGLSSPAEAQSIIPGWSKQFYYRYGSVVIYEGRRYRAIKPSKDKAPADNPTYWLDLGDYPLEGYVPGLGYTIPADRAEGGITAKSDVPEAPSVMSDDGTTPPAESDEPLARDAWNATQVYSTIGQVVSYQGKRWRNIAWTQGERPGEGSAWVALNIDASDATPDWNSQTIYEEPSLRVKHNGLTWENSAWTQGEEPGRAAVWKATGRDSTGVENWDELKTYSEIGLVVRHLGRTWRNTAWTQGEEPGYAAVWVEPEADRAGAVADWDPTRIYDLPGTIVMHDGRMWQSTGWTQGEEPGYAPVWKEYGARDPSAVEPWNSETVYSTVGTYVSHEGKVWSNSAWTQGEEPGTADVWSQVTADEPDSETGGGSEQPGSDDEWVATKVYDQAGTKVRYSGQIWANRWWTVGDEPGVTDAWVWVESEDGESAWRPTWQPGYVYDTPGTEVEYEGHIWANAYWTRGDVPGESAAWRLISSPGDEPLNWHPQMAYETPGTQVEYEGRIWANAYWTRGEIPGESAAWRLVRSMVDEPLNWHPQMVYDTPGTVVIYDDVLWRNKWWAEGKDIPGGATGAWELVSAGEDQNAPWDASRSYPVGSEVDFESRHWRAENATQGEEPGTGAAWALISATTTEPLIWNALTHYVMLDVQVRHEGRIWSNLQDSRADVPGASSAWKLVSSETTEPLTWHNAVIFDRAGITVRHNGALWENKWWTQGDEPGNSDVWQAVVSDGGGPQNWNPSIVYDQAGTIVIYNGQQWENKWWTQGDEPGNSDVWQAIVSDEGAPQNWNSSKVYDQAGTIVIYDGQQWQNKWWTQGDTPGASDGPWELVQ